MDTKFLLCGSITLSPTYINKPPSITVMLNDKEIWQGKLASTTDFLFNEELFIGTHRLSVIFANKTDDDSDQMVTIDKIVFENIASDSFVHRGCYRPIYPEPWASQQREQGHALANELFGGTMLGWNGTWELEFTVPIFTWIHQVENLGWIYN